MKEFSVNVECDTADQLREALEYTASFITAFPSMFEHLPIDGRADVMQSEGVTITVYRPA